ncbi:MAG: hypothetical protein JSW56_03825 [Deltaproteobacteria bacterium]|nr:MAG: hypothetical protein JSW56_03825 [Deltaproteobacteria bacterium]
MSIDSSVVRGEFEKKAVVWSNDLARRSVALYLRGEVKPYISLEPGGYLSLWGVKGQVPKESLEIINNHDQPLKIMGIEDDLPGHIGWEIKEIKPGYLYILTVEDISSSEGDYTGHLIIKTDNPNKPALVVIINGQIETAPTEKDSGG